MIREFVSLYADVQALKNAFGRGIRVGPVEEVHPEKGYRISYGDVDGKPFLSPWIAHPETGKTSEPLKKGQIVGVLAVAGDPRQSLLIRGGYSDEHASPNQDMQANVLEDAGVRITIAGGALHISAGGFTASISGAGLAMNGGRIEHDGKNIGGSHTHPGVVVGGANTLDPNP